MISATALSGRCCTQVQVELDHIGAQEGHRKGISASESGWRRRRPAPPTRRQRGPLVSQGEQPGWVGGQRPFGQLEDQTDPPLAQGGKKRCRRLDPIDRGGFDVDEQPERCGQAGVQRRFQRSGLAQPVQLVHPAGATGRREQQIGHRQRAARRTAGERLEGDRLTRAQVDDRLEDRTDVPRCEQRVQLTGQLRGTYLANSLCIGRERAHFSARTERSGTGWPEGEVVNPAPGKLDGDPPARAADLQLIAAAGPIEAWAGRVGQAVTGWQVLVAVSRPKTASRLVAEYAGVQVVSTMVGCGPCGPATSRRTAVSSGGTTVLPVTA